MGNTITTCITGNIIISAKGKKIATAKNVDMVLATNTQSGGSGSIITGYDAKGGVNNMRSKMNRILLKTTKIKVEIVVATDLEGVECQKGMGMLVIRNNNNCQNVALHLGKAKVSGGNIKFIYKGYLCDDFEMKDAKINLGMDVMVNPL